MQKRKIDLLLIFILIINTIFSFTPLTITVWGDPYGGNISGDTVYWENEYANLSVYPHTDYEIITHTQYANLTWLYSDQTIDVAFRFNDSITGHLWRWDGDQWQDVEMQHTTHNDKYYYYYQGFNVVQDTQYRFKWIYNTTANTTGKWDLMAKLNSESIAEALASGHYVMLDPWWDASWSSRVGITVAGSELWGDSSFTNFPLLVNLSSITGIDDRTQSGGWDLRFINQDNDTEYYYHKAETSWSSFHKVWVLIPSMTPHTDFYFNCYFNNEDATRSAYYSGDNVWGSKYIAVYYMNSTLDMSGNGYDITYNAGVTFTDIDSSIGNCGYFDGENQYMRINSDAIENAILGTDGGGFLCGVLYIGENDGYVLDYNDSTTDDQFRNYISRGGHYYSKGVKDGSIMWNTGDPNCPVTGNRIDLIGTQMTETHYYQWGYGLLDNNWGYNSSVVGIPEKKGGRFAIGCNAQSLTSTDFNGYIDTLIFVDSPFTDNEMHLWGYNFNGTGLLSFSELNEIAVQTTNVTDKTENSFIAHGSVNDSVDDEFKCGFIYGTTSPVTSSNAEGNVTGPDTYETNDLFEYNVTGLTSGELYYIKSWINNSQDKWAYGNEIDSFLYPGNASNLIISSLENGFRFDWDHGNGYDASIFVVNNTGVGAYPSHPDDTDSTQLYNGTNNYYEHTGIDPGATYYYSLWEYASEGAYSEHSLGYITLSDTYKDYTIYCNDTTDITEYNATLHGSFSGAGLNGNYNYGFWIGTTSPIVEGSYDTNISIGIGTDGTEYEHDISILNDGVAYYVKAWFTNDSIWETSTEESFTTVPSEPTNFNIEYESTNRSLHFTWNIGYTEPATTAIYAKKDSYPTGTDDTTADVMNNDSGTSYWFENRAGTKWYFRIWGHANPFSGNYSEGYYFIPPYPPTDVGTTVETNSSFTISWTKGINASTTVVRRKLNEYPSTVTDGDQLYNGTGEQLNIEVIEGSYYYKLWSYANETYSEGVTVDVGGLVVNCYDENTNESLEFDIRISNEDGSETYESRNNTNPHVLNISQLPLGEDVKIVVSASQNYTDKTEIFDGYPNDENYTITYVVLLYPPESKETTNVTCENVSSGHKSYPQFTIVDDIITILPDHADEFTKIYVNYSYGEYRPRTYHLDLNESSFYLLNAYLPPILDVKLYLLSVIDQYSESVENARIDVKRSVNGTFVIVSSLLTDSSGEADIYLIPFKDYIFTISKEGYVTVNVSWTPGDQIFTKKFRIEVQTTEPSGETIGDIILFNGRLYDNGSILVEYFDKNSETINSHIIIYEYYNDTLTFIAEYSNTSEYNIDFWYSVSNTSRSYIVSLYVNHTTLGQIIDYRIYINPLHPDRDQGGWLETLFGETLGEWNYGYVLTILWYLPALILIIGFGAMHYPGFGVFSAGLYSIFLTWYIYVPEEAKILTFAGIAIVIGIIAMILVQGKKVIN
jgi:hypothetical protein